MHQRGAEADYQGWVEMGAEGWSYDEVAPVFERIELRGADPDSAPVGRLPIIGGDGKHTGGVSQAFMEACGAAGHPTDVDLNARSYEGAGWVEFNMHAGRRYSARKAFLEPALRKDTVELRGETRATRLVLDEAGRCTEVELRGPDGEASRVGVGAEVLVCAGAIETPKLLLLSGIGAPESLHAHGIDPVLELPGVGRDLHDHAMVWVRHDLAQPLPCERLMNYEVSMFLRSRPDMPACDLEFICMDLSFDDLDAGREATAVDFIACVVRPDARGRVELADADWRTPPVIQVNYLGEAHDRERLRQATRLLRDVLGQAPLKDALGKEVRPGPEVRSDADLDAYIRKEALAQWHIAGSCRMGAASDPDAVVDPQLRLRGAANVRVADASVMPRLVSAHCHAATAMIGTRATDFVLDSAPG